MKNSEQRMQDLLARQKVVQARRSRRRTMVLRSATAAGSVALAAAVALFVWLPGTPAKQLPAPPTASAAGSSVPAPASSADTYAPGSPADAAPPAASEPTTAEVVNSAAHLSDASVASASNNVASGAPTDTKTADHNTKTPSSEPTKSVSENTKSPSSAASQSGTTSSTANEPVTPTKEFSSIEAFQQWATAENLQGFLSPSAFKELTTDHGIEYWYPKGLVNYPNLKFQMASIRENSGSIRYDYDFADRSNISQPSFNTYLIWYSPQHVLQFEPLIAYMKQIENQAKSGDKNYACIERNGITYYCMLNVEPAKTLYIEWMQDDGVCVFVADPSQTEYAMTLEDIIPYLTVEKVTIPLQ